MPVRVYNATERTIGCAFIDRSIVQFSVKPNVEETKDAVNLFVLLNFSVSGGGDSSFIGSMPYFTLSDNYVDIVTGGPPAQVHASRDARAKLAEYVYVWCFLKADNTTHFLGAVPKAIWAAI